MVLQVLLGAISWNASCVHGQTRSPEEPPADGKATSAEKPPPEFKRTRSSDIKVIPSLILSERYDSNVLFTPSGVDIGTKKWDFVTTAAPTLQLLNTNRYVDTTLTGGVSGSVFVNNPNLNFVSTYVTGRITLDKLINQIIRGAKLQVADTFSYSPETPSFVPAGSTTPTDNPFARGLIPFRVDMYTNTASIAASYPLMPALSVDGNYSYSLLRIGKILVDPSFANQTSIFNTNQHAWSVGPNWRLSRSDNLILTYRATNISLQDKSGRGVDVEFNAQGLEAIYSKKTGDWGATISGGGSILDQGDKIYATGALTVSAKYDEATLVNVAGSRQIAPGFFGTAGALISTTAGISVIHKLSNVLTLTGNANFAYNEFAPVNIASFQSYTGSALLAYNLSRMWTTSLMYSYTYFEVDSTNIASQNILGYVMNRHFVTFSIAARWN